MTVTKNFSWQFALLVVALAPPASAQGFGKTELTPISEVLSKYDCESSSPASRHVGQIILGVYYEWTESYSQLSNGTYIHCIRGTVPTPSTLNLREAIEFLEKSRGLGAASDPNTQRERSQETPEASEIENMMRRAKPMPLLQPQSSNKETLSTHQSALASIAPETLTSLVQLLPGTVGDRPQYGAIEWNAALARIPGAAHKNSPARSTALIEDGAKLERPLVAGLDERQRVLNPIFPANVTGRLYQEYQDGSTYVCSATLINRYVAVTAGHCLHSRDEGGYATRVVFVPQQTQITTGGAITRPYSYKVASHISVNARWTQISGGSKIIPTDARYDYGAVYFSTPWTYTSTFAPIVYAHTGSYAINIGYPSKVGDAEGNEGEWYDEGSEASRSLSYLRSYQVREFVLDVSGGNSGGPYIGTDGTNYFLVGIVSYGGDDLAGGVWLGGGNEANFRSLAAWTPSSAAPSRVPEGLRAPILLSSNVIDGESHLRFFNNSPASGTVTFRFYDINGADIGGWTTPGIAPNATRQFSMAEIEQKGLLLVRDNLIYSAKITSTFTGLFQHVAWNRIGESLTNLSGCSNGLSTNISTAINVRSSLNKDAYPSYIVLHSLEDSATDITADLYAASTGEHLGGVIFKNVPGNASGILPIEPFENAMEFTPTGNQYHYNIVLTGNTAAYIQHQVENEGAGVTTNMTATCTM
jgi:V8-like Glu-specific endopeptidase